MAKRIIKLIKEEFETIINTKTGWSKNEILQAHDQAIWRALVRYLDEEEEKL